MRIASLLLLLVCAATSVRAQAVWDEAAHGDAGPLPATAQILAATTTPYAAITGEIAARGDVDMYRIYIADPANFSATTEPATVGSLADTRLYLFDEQGRGVAFNDDTPGGTGSLRSTLPAGHPYMPTTPGHYYLAVTSFEIIPVYQLDRPIFANPRSNAFQFNGVFPSLNDFRIGQWVVAGGGATGTYQIELTGGVVPVELTAFEATLDGAAALLRWTTASETNNAGFAIEHRGPNAAAFAEAAFVEGHGTTTEAQAYTFRLDALAPGTHAFRLRQVDFDGTTAYGPEVEVTVALAEAFRVEAAYPNPFNPETTIRFAVRDAGPVRAELFDVTGRLVQTLYAGTPAAGTTETLRIDGNGLPTGLYIVRIAGEGFSHAQKLTLTW